MKKTSICEYCEEPFPYRLNKRFCSPNCRAKHKYAQKKSQPQPKIEQNDKQIFSEIIEKICCNREILVNIAKSNIERISISELLHKGYNPTYMTHTLLDSDSSVLVYCFDYGLKPISEDTYQVIFKEV